MVICDISPLGIETARQAGIPSVLIENFTWDWIYEEYETTFPQIKTHIQYLKTIFQSADFHIQTEPIGFRQKADLTAMPAGRKPRNSRAAIRNRLGIQPDDKMILITTGGIKQKLGFSEKLQNRGKTIFVIPGGSNGFEISGNIIRFPHHSEFFHPDLVNAADAVVGKAGYSTIAEVYQARIPFGFVSRPDFRESDRLAEFIQREMTGLPVPEPEFQDGSWVDRIEELLARLVPEKTAPNAADAIADFILGLRR
jgi:UDP-N-acetylglucosamine:LPS N-acetylglucosamine transferase